MRDCLVCGIRHENTQKRLLSESDLSLTKAIELARRIEAAEMQLTQLKATGSAPVMNVKATQRRNQACDTSDKHGACTRCGGRNHQAKDCHYKDVRCRKCHKQGHFAKMCITKTSSTTIPPGRHFKQTNMVEETPDSDSDNAIL